MNKKHTLSFRNLVDEQDYPLLVDLNQRSRAADRDLEKITLGDVADALARMQGLTPQQGVIIALLEGAPIGYSRLGWYASRPETRLYYQVSFMIPEQRDLWPDMIAENERRLSQLAGDHARVPESFFQAWASQNQRAWSAALERSGYRIARRFNNMLYALGEAPSLPMPEGLQVREVLPEDMRKLWEAQREMNSGLFENVAEDWLEDKFPAWLTKPENQPRFWQVAWDGDRLAGMVLAHLGEGAEGSPGAKHGYTEHIYVRPQWRGRGLASALISRGLQALKAQGATEAELGVDTENESAAYRLYERLGYKTFSVDTWYRKSMPV